MTEPITLGPPASLAQGRLVYQRLTRRRLVLLAGIAALTVACFVLDLSIGQARYSALQVLSGVWNSDASLAIRVILWDIRLPVALTALVVGASLSVAGAHMQTVLGNPLASPFTLGLSAAASFGAALGLILGSACCPHRRWRSRSRSMRFWSRWPQPCSFTI